MRHRPSFSSFRRPWNPPSSPSHLNISTIAHESIHPSRTRTSILSTDYQVYTHLLQQLCKQIKIHHLFDEMSQPLARASNACRVIHAQSLKYGVGSNGLLGNAIVDLYAKCGNVDFAEKAFTGLGKRDILAWNSVLSMYSRRGMLEQVIESFCSLQESGVLPNEFTSAIVLSACARLVDIEYGRQVHCHAIKLGLNCCSFCEGAIVDMYVKCNFLSDARRIIDEAVKPDRVSWTSIIGGYVQAGLPEEALKMFEEMKRIGCVPDQVAFVTAMHACVRLGRVNDACDLFYQMPNPNVIAWNVMISGHTQNGYELEAIKFFQSMRKASVISSRSTLGSVLSAIASLAALDFGLLVHAEAIKQGLSSNVYVGSSLINMYAKCEKMEAAKKVFDALHDRNVVLWNAMLGGYAQNGYAYEVMDLFSIMKDHGFQPDEFTYTSILSACSCLEYLEIGCQLHTISIKKKFASNLFVGNALVDMYAKCGALKDARKQFERIKNRDTVSWNAIIVGYVQEEDEAEAFNMFRLMNLSGIVPDEVALASVLSACANIQGLKPGTQIHCLSVKSGLETSLYAGSSLIDMYAKCEAIEAAHKVFSRMPMRSVASMNALIGGFAQNNLREAINLFQEMQLEGLNPSEITFVCILDACDGLLTLNLGRQMHCHILRRGLMYDDDFLGVSLLAMYMKSQRNMDANILFSEFSNPRSAILWTAIISGHSQNDCSEEALKFYQDMRSHNVLPDQATFVSVLRACAVSSSLREGRVIHSLIFHIGYDMDESTASTLVDMYAKCGDMKSSVQVFEEMGSKGDVISWNSMIVGFAKNGYAEDALKMFNTMIRQTHVTPDDVTFLGVLTACSHAGKVSEGRAIFDLMTNCYGIEPRADHSACMVDLLGRWGFLREAEEFIDNLKFEPAAMIWATMLGACSIHGDDKRGRRAAEKLIELEPQNSSPYVLLSNIYAASENWDEVNALRRKMKEKGVRKLPGCSWIVVGQKTSLFVAGDKFHPCAGEIDLLLNCLMDVMKKDNKLFKVEICSFLYDEV